MTDALEETAIELVRLVRENREVRNRHELAIIKMRRFERAMKQLRAKNRKLRKESKA